MSSKRQRHAARSSRRDPPTAPSNARAVRKWLWKTGLVLGGILLALGAWWGVDYRSSSDKSPVNPAAGDVAPTGPSAAKLPDVHHQRSSQNDPAFGSRVNHGNELLAEGKPAEAVEVLTEAMKIHPNDEDVHYDLGLALAHLGKADEAIQQYQEALRLFPNYVEAHNNLGNLLMRRGQIEEAIQHFESALKSMPDYASAHNNLGTALQRTGQTNEALVQFRQAAKLKPDYWEAHFNVATTCLQAGQLDEAQSELETVLRLQPDFQPARLALAEVQAREASGAH